MVDENEAISPETETPAGEPQSETTSETGTGAPQTHYKSLEEADAAARRFQGESDRLKAEVQRLSKWGTSDQIDQFLTQYVPLTQREDFADWVSGKLARSQNGPVEDSEDEYLTDSQKALREQAKSAEDKSSRTYEAVAIMQLQQAEKNMRDDWGDLLEPYRSGAMNLFQQMVKNGMVNDISKVDPTFVENLFLQQIPRSDRDALWERKAQLQAQKKLQHQQSRATTVPSSERSSSADETAPKNLWEAMQRAKRDASAKAAHGG